MVKKILCVFFMLQCISGSYSADKEASISVASLELTNWL